MIVKNYALICKCYLLFVTYQYRLTIIYLVHNPPLSMRTALLCTEIQYCVIDKMVKPGVDFAKTSMALMP